MRKTLIALTASTGFLAMGAIAASAAPVPPLSSVSRATAPEASIQQADWYCGPRCQYWHHRHWVERHRWRNYGYYYHNNGYYYR
jgi:hypothetical protein